MTRKAVVCLSGGVDAYISAFATREFNIKLTHAVFIDYGQPALWSEYSCAKLQADRLGVKLTALKVPIPSFPLDQGRDTVGDEGSIPFYYVAHRNLIIASVAAAATFESGVDTVVLGFHEADQHCPDSTTVFAGVLGSILTIGSGRGYEVFAPFRYGSKEDVLEYAYNASVQINDCTWSCYLGGETPCGTCSGCRERDRAIANCERGAALRSSK